MTKNVNMCDLIDLNSPDRKGLFSTRLASPLIPVPTNTTNGNFNNRINEPNPLTIGKRDSLENNPFDMVLHKTTEYIQKKDDPFEETLEKALRPKCKKKTTLRTSSFDYTDKLALKQRETTQTMKMNRTLDEALINKELSKKNTAISKTTTDNVVVDLKSINALSDDLKSDNINVSFTKDNYNIPTINIEDIDLSILNQSVMNDTLFEMESQLNKNQMKSPSEDRIQLSCVQKDVINIEQIPVSVASLKVLNPKHRRSFSQGENISPKTSNYSSQMSLVERIRCESISSACSANSYDTLNEGFIRSHCGSSIFSSLSSISSIPKLNSTISTINSSLTLSSATINRAFLESCSSQKSDITRLSEDADISKETNSALFAINNSATAVVDDSKKKQFLLSDLTDRFNKLKVKTSDVQISGNSMNEENEEISNVSTDVKEYVTVVEKNEESNKLIDVDVFTPELNCSKEQYKSSVSDISSDSVFLEGSKVNKSIFHEAKLLAKTFEELALKTSSGSSIDDLMTSNPLWTSELLPAFDDEAMIDNLIELPTSPTVNDINTRREEVSAGVDNDSNKNGKADNNKVEENIKELEMELIEPICTEKRISAATLLLDLKKLIKTENNMEANKLLENLEKVLGVNCESNTELLTTYLNSTNNLAKSPQKSSSSLEIIKNVAENNMEHSQEDNLTTDSPENMKGSTFCAHMNLNNSNMSKRATNNEKCLKEINSELQNDISEINVSTEKINKGKDIDDNIQNAYKKKSPCKQENGNLLNEKMAMELLTNLAKLLSGQTGEHSTLTLLKSVGNALNSVPNNCNVDKRTKTDNADDVRIQQTPQKSKLTYENKTQHSLLSKSVNRLSLDVESKKPPPNKNFIRRSISVSQTPPVKAASSPLMSKGGSTSQLREVTKRFPSDPGFISPTANNKVITNNNKNEIGKDTRGKSVTTVDSQKETTTVVNTVKNKLKKKIGMDVINKKGPMKAILPIRSMQKRESIGKKIIPPAETVTPPKTHKIVSSTPNSTNNGCTIKKSSRSSKPVASSTPDAQNSKTRKVESQISSCPKKRNFSCDISPVTTRVHGSQTNGTNNHPRRSSKLPSPKKTTPKRSIESNIPKSRTPPVHKRLNASFDVNQYERLHESPQRSSYKITESQKSSPISVKKSGDNIQHSPLRDNNKLIHKVKPINLISKLRRHSFGTSAMEKENNYI